ncbi:CRISPR-associated helicase Cas3' [Nonomuraea sp. NEAU-A123]|uniref:CRISPR-associated helicase Cas3' n=1 Tax=Nonomuraea sp. NEAU-A123 TaxID=2839649 RepID=UPI001BE447CC|nr:CRISPR-associated helicase Cas3' [Nonomuraea sp. NEAU-A123]MBT2234439.1 CRISPR-associated helicase Cas3' [Nonomuraea sp. NEAU-A123]
MQWHDEFGYDSVLMRQLGALWGKSRQKAGGRTNLLLSHLLDTAAVAEQIWDNYLPPSAKQTLNDISNGRGRSFFAWLCGVHDCGKATPAFQRVDAEGAEAVRRAGLSWNELVVKRARWRHDKAGGALLLRLLREVGWEAGQIAWLWPLVAGHHGSVPAVGALAGLRTARGEPQGQGPAWIRVQSALVEVFTRLVGFKDLADVQPENAPSRAVQLQLSGLVVMADWIASDERHFAGVDDLADVTMQRSQARALKAWGQLGLRGGWGRLECPTPEAFEQRFDQPPRPSQELVTRVAGRMPGPGLLIVEAPMGEGKTKAALLAAEVLAARFGADGVFVGMPTQATSDPMFSQVRAWLNRIDGELAGQVALLHGKRMFNKEWQSLLDEPGTDPDSFYGSVEEDDLYGLADSPFSQGVQGNAERQAPAEWFLGRKRGLLSPFVVGTIDQLLFAATRTKHVMLRAAGLMGKVVVLDEVHAADVYMSQFLKEGLRWLGQARVPVVLLSATLPPAQRRELVEAYLAGAASAEVFDAAELPQAGGYPSVSAVCLAGGRAVYDVDHVRQWRSDLNVSVTVLPEALDTGTAGDGRAAEGAVAELLQERLAQGGCALVIRNTVPRAQRTYQALRERFGDEVRLLHGRMTAHDRAEGTQECLNLLGPSREEGSPRPGRLILVATQLAEQSFDVDADVLVTDLTTIDLLLQRLGRVHRHDGVLRPERVRRPQVVITGFAPRGGAAPAILAASEAIYGRYLLLRTAAVVCAADGGHWSVPGDVPSLVGRVYGDARDVVPSAWAEDEQQAHDAWVTHQQDRARSAEHFLLTQANEHTKATLDGLHYGAATGSLAEHKLQAVVRDGDRSVEVILVRHDERGYRTLGGRWLGVNGEALSDELLEEVLGATVRLPAKLTEPAERELPPLDGWRDHPWLKRSLALVLDSTASGSLGEYAVRYDDELGLVVDGGPQPPFRRRT